MLDVAVKIEVYNNGVNIDSICKIIGGMHLREGWELDLQVYRYQAAHS
jgi:hypothetical protein